MVHKTKIRQQSFLKEISASRKESAMQVRSRQVHSQGCRREATTSRGAASLRAKHAKGGGPGGGMCPPPARSAVAIENINPRKLRLALNTTHCNLCDLKYDAFHLKRLCDSSPATQPLRELRSKTAKR